MAAAVSATTAAVVVAEARARETAAATAAATVAAEEATEEETGGRARTADLSATIDQQESHLVSVVSRTSHWRGSTPNRAAVSARGPLGAPGSSG
jgi:hypothetical protein